MQVAATWNHAAFDYMMLKDEENNFFVKYEDIVEKNDEVINKIMEIGKLTREQVDHVIGVKINSTRRNRDLEEIDKITRYCGRLMKELEYI